MPAPVNQLGIPRMSQQIDEKAGVRRVDHGASTESVCPSTSDVRINFTSPGVRLCRPARGPENCP